MQHLQEYIRTRPQNLFATASWLHLLLTHCHPFDVSDSLPFPDAFPNIDLDQRAEYYEGIRGVSDWVAHGGIPLTMSHSGARGRSRTVDEMFRRWHAKNPRVYSETLVVRDL